MASCFAICSALALLGYLIWSSHEEEIRAAETTTRNYAAVIEAQLDAALRRADADLRTLQATIPRAALELHAVPRFAATLNAGLKARLSDFPELDGIRVFDADGNALYFSDEKLPPNTAIGNRSHFLAVKQNPQAGLVFSEVLTSRIHGRASVFAIRALHDGGGHFRGAIVAAINLAHFQKLFESLDIGARGAISWRRSDNQKLILRSPEIAALVNKPLSAGNSTVKSFAKGQLTTTQHIRAESDGVLRIYSSQALEHFPFYLGVAFSHDDVLAAWRLRSLIVGLCGLLLVVLLLGMIARLWRVEDSLIENEQLMRGTFEQAAVGIAHVDALTLRILIANNRYCKLTGYSLDELTASDVHLLIPPDEESTRDIERAQVFSGQRLTVASERRMQHKDGSVIWVHRSLSMVRDDNGQPLYFISVIEDISARKQIESEMDALNAGLEARVAERTAELETTNQELSAFSYTVAHDLRAPVRAINGFSTMVLTACAGLIDAKSQSNLKRVIAASERMGNLIDDLLSLARLSRQELQPRQFDLGEMAVSIVGTHTAASPERDSTIRIQSGMLAHGDTSLMHAALENLIGNAWKFTAKTDKATISVGSEHRDGRTVFHVRDNGAGFDMLYAHKLFAPFQRLHHASEFEGTGIGLATVKKIIQRHGGTIWIESAVGIGTTVYFTVAPAT